MSTTTDNLRHHTTWCVDCADECGEWERHDGAPRKVALTAGGLSTGLRNDPDRDELEIFAMRKDNGATMIDLGTDEATSGCEGSMWLSVDEARRYAEAILAVVEEVER